MMTFMTAFGTPHTVGIYGKPKWNGDGEDLTQPKGSKMRRSKKDTSKTPVLDNFGRDLTKHAIEGRLDPIVGRMKEIERIKKLKRNYSYGIFIQRMNEIFYF